MNRWKPVPVEPTSDMLNSTVQAFHTWKARDNGGSIQELGSLVWTHMVDAAPTPAQEYTADADTLALEVTNKVFAIVNTPPEAGGLFQTKARVQIVIHDALCAAAQPQGQPLK